jgi:aspartate kinase
VAIVKDEARILLDGVPDQPGVSHRVFSALAAKNIVVDMIAQGVGSGGKAAIGFTVPKGESPATLTVLEPLAREMGARVQSCEDVSKVSIVGAGMRTHTGVAERMFAALAAEKVNMQMITTGDIKISVLVDKKDGMRAVRAVHQAFALDKPRPGSGGPTPADPKLRLAARPVAGNGNGADLYSRLSRLTGMEDIVVSDVQLGPDHAQITVFDLPDQPGNCSSIFQAVASAGIVVDMIVQNLGNNGRAELTFSVPRDELTRALKRTQDAVRAIDAEARVVGDNDIAVLFVFGVGMRTHTGVARKMFGALADRGINIRMINTSEVCISVVVERSRGDEALASLRETFQV